ncbi:unnamed protein product, partial [Owenia fusiformis]
LQNVKEKLQICKIREQTNHRNRLRAESINCWAVEELRMSQLGSNSILLLSGQRSTLNYIVECKRNDCKCVCVVPGELIIRYKNQDIKNPKITNNGKVTDSLGKDVCNLFDIKEEDEAPYVIYKDKDFRFIKLKFTKLSKVTV